MGTPANITTLNEYAKGLFQAASNPTADFLSPVVPTGSAQFYVTDYAKRSAFQVPSAIRAIGGDSKAVMVDGDRVQITLNPNALHDFIDDHELALAGDGGGQNLLRQARVRNLVSQGGNARLGDLLTVVRAGVAATPEVWGSSDDPVADIDAQVLAISNKIGIMPNRVLFSINAWSLFRNNAKVIARYPGAAEVSAQIGMVGSLFLNPNMQVQVATSVFDTPIAATSTKKNALDNGTGAEVYVYYAADNADQFDASFMKTFRIKQNAFGRVRVERKDFGEKPILEWTESPYLNNADAGVRLQITAS